MSKKWIDALGQEVPETYVKGYDRLRDKIARRIAKRFADERGRLERCYRETMADIEDLERAAGKESKPLGGLKGNLQFCSFDGLIQIYRSARYDLQFDERLQVARDMIYKFIDEKANGVDEDIAVVIRGIFQPTSEGMLSTSRVMGLFRYKIKASAWLQAMDLIRESIATRRGKTLIGVNVKANREAEWTPILLDIAKCAGIPEDAEQGTEGRGQKAEGAK